MLAVHRREVVPRLTGRGADGAIRRVRERALLEARRAAPPAARLLASARTGSGRRTGGREAVEVEIAPEGMVERQVAAPSDDCSTEPESAKTLPGTMSGQCFVTLALVGRRRVARRGSWRCSSRRSRRVRDGDRAVVVDGSFGDRTRRRVRRRPPAIASGARALRGERRLRGSVSSSTRTMLTRWGRRRQRPDPRRVRGRDLRLEHRQLPRRATRRLPDQRQGHEALAGHRPGKVFALSGSVEQSSLGAATCRSTIPSGAISTSTCFPTPRTPPEPVRGRRRGDGRAEAQHVELERARSRTRRIAPSAPRPVNRGTTSRR